ncbi:hypothetical protein EZV62_009194 [Acer yangbiense]|uniref:C-JID domain-containing protein n=1 Tax=Acer yangbiense TaxID=1000413 RepID=A0A5C7IFY9_9ROSI|nr:hypothetical protein EZV62_009194 [Acer yangbiense]
MPKLKFLKFYNSQNEKSSKVHIPQGLDSTFTELRYFHWHAYPLKSLPSKFDPENLFVLDMPYSNLEQLWNANQCFDRLSIINLSHSNLTKIPDLSGSPYLESLPDDMKSLRALKKLKAARTGIREVPSSISCLNNLGTFSLRGDGFGIALSFIRLDQSDESSSKIQSLPTLPRDLKLEAQGCTSLEEFISTPFASSASLALAVNFINCLQLEQNALTNLVEYALQKIQLMPTAFCTEFDEDCDEMLRVFICYPSSEIPEWFTFQSMGSSVIARQLPQGWFSDKLTGFALCAVVAFQDHHDDGRGLVLVCEGKFRSHYGYCHVAKSNLIAWGDDYPGILYVGSDHVFLGCDFVMYPENFGEDYYSNEVSMQFYLEDCHSKRMECCEVKSCGFRLIYSQDESKERTNGWFGADMEEEEEEEDPFSPDPKKHKLSASFEEGTPMEFDQKSKGWLCGSAAGWSVLAAVGVFLAGSWLRCAVVSSV